MSPAFQIVQQYHLALRRAKGIQGPQKPGAKRQVTTWDRSPSNIWAASLGRHIAPLSSIKPISSLIAHNLQHPSREALRFSTCVDAFERKQEGVLSYIFRVRGAPHHRKCNGIGGPQILPNERLERIGVSAFRAFHKRCSGVTG